MFGLGPMELILIAAVVMLIAGPAAIPKLFKGLQSFQKAKSKLTPKGIVDELMKQPTKDDDPPKRKAKKKKKRKRDA